MTTIPEYPRNLPLLSVEVTERMKWSGTIQTHASGSEGRLSYWSEPLWEFDLQYNGLRDGFWGDRAYDELSQIQGLFGVSAGSTQGFKYLHPKWNSVSHQRIGFLSGGLTTYDLVRSYGPFSDASLQAVEHIGVLSDEVPFNLYVSNSSVPLLPTDPSYGYTLDTSKPGQQQLIFNSVPPSGHTIFADMGYFFYCRFAQGPFEYQKFAKNLYGAQKVSLVSCRAESQ